MARILLMLVALLGVIVSIVYAIHAWRERNILKARDEEDK